MWGKAEVPRHEVNRRKAFSGLKFSASNWRQITMASEILSALAHKSRHVRMVIYPFL